MNIITSLWCIIVVIAIIEAHGEPSQPSRQPKLLSLFSIVQFKQGPCVQASDTSKRGICMTTQQCMDRGGSASGNCAAGFGVCCGFTASACGSAIKENCTYITNPNFPSATATGSCEYTFSRICEDLCQIRLDFDNFQTSSPPGTGAADMEFGDCSVSGDVFTATSPTGVSPPVVCGTLTGQHMYLETGTIGDAAKINFDITSAAATYEIKATYYQCSSLNKAPPNCVQYLTGVSGSFQSYNFQGMVVNDNQNYLTCIRQERGYCSIQYSAETFNLLGDTAGTPEAAAETISCVDTVVFIPNIVNSMHCGSKFSTIDADTLSGVVTSETTPFQVLTIFKDAFGTNADTKATVGYDLRYTQQPC